MKAGAAWIASLLFWHGAVGAAVTATDDRGVSVTLARPATRVVSLSPHVTELLYAAGAGSRVVGAVAYSDYPPEARKLPLVGDASRLDVERVLALRPDLVVGWSSGNPTAEVARLERLGINVYMTEPRRLNDIARHLVELARLTGSPAEGQDAAAKLSGAFDKLRREYGSRAPVSVFYQIWPQPLSTVGGAHIIDEVLRVCGGHNIFGHLRTLAPMVSMEAVLQADPQAIIAGDEKGAGDLLGHWRRWRQIRAVREGQLYTVPADYLHRQTPRILLGAREVCKHLEAARRRASIH